MAIQVIQHISAAIYATVGPNSKQDSIFGRYGIPTDRIISSCSIYRSEIPRQFFTRRRITAATKVVSEALACNLAETLGIRQGVDIEVRIHDHGI
ncbi:hypothetical protein F4810DRAFT_696249 [Camillea tinctor]|nr:hypothetical protein F4810DRAFT_696249 [Camillea tinctor]